MAVTPFRIEVPDAALDELRAAIARTRWPDEVEGRGLGLRHAARVRPGARRVLGRRVPLARARAGAQLAPPVPHRRSTRPGSRTSACTSCTSRASGPRRCRSCSSHGWPSTHFEYHDVVMRLANPGAFGDDPADAFHVVVPSLPGYGFSDIPTSTRHDPARDGDDVRRARCASSGTTASRAAGCDWGAYVTALLGLDHPDALVGIHMGMLNFRAAGPYERTAEDAEYGARAKAWRREESGYSEIQGTKPQSLAYGLMDSPAALTAWIVEKWRRWSDCAGDVQQLFTRDELLTTVAIYWFTGTINSANRLYYESRHDPIRLAEGERVRPPAGFLFERVVGGAHAEHRTAAAGPGRRGLRRAAVDGRRPGAPLPRHREPRPLRRGAAGVLPSPPLNGDGPHRRTPDLTRCQNGAMTTATIDLLDLDRFQRLEHHAMFERLRAEDPVSWHEYPGEPGLLERRDPRGRPHRQPRLRALLVGGRRRDDHEPRGAGRLRHPRADDALHRPAEAHALPPAREQGLHAAHDRHDRAVPAQPLAPDRRQRDRARAVRLRRRPRVGAPAPGDRRDHGRAAGGPSPHLRVVERDDRRRRPRVRGRRRGRARGVGRRSTRTPTTSPSSAAASRATTSSPS